MKKFKDTNNATYEIEEGFEHLLPVDCVEIDQAEFNSLTTSLPLTDKEFNNQVNVELREIDLASIRSLREYVSAQPDAPQWIKDKEVEAITKRATKKILIL